MDEDRLPVLDRGDGFLGAQRLHANKPSPAIVPRERSDRLIFAPTNGTFPSITFDRTISPGTNCSKGAKRWQSN